MNMVGLLFNQVIPMAIPNHDTNVHQMDSEIESSFFQQLLLTEQNSKEIPLNDEFNHSDFISIEDLFSKLSDMPIDELKELYNLLVGNTELEDGVDEDERAENLTSLIHELFESQGELEIPLWSQLKTEIQIEQQSNYEQLATYFVNPSVEESLKLVPSDQETITKQFHEIFAQVELLLNKVSHEQDLIRISPRMLELLEKWTALQEKYGNEISQNSILPASTLTASTSETKEQSIWKELVNTFQKRNELASNQYYQTSAKVTVKDISKWLQSNLNAQVILDGNVNTQYVNLSNQPLSKVEQYVIYMNQSETTQPMDKQLIDQFQQVMRTSRFLSLNNGVNQLSIALRPDNLGEMMVRFTEINGEMTLKIIVTSQAARQMLESNIHQLKNMFSPHQVVIEEREVILENVQSPDKEQAFDEEEDHPHESNQEETRNFEEDFETQFHEILMNEEV